MEVGQEFGHLLPAGAERGLRGREVELHAIARRQEHAFDLGVLLAQTRQGPAGLVAAEGQLFASFHVGTLVAAADDL